MQIVITEREILEFAVGFAAVLLVGFALLDVRVLRRLVLLLGAVAVVVALWSIGVDGLVGWIGTVRGHVDRFSTASLLGAGLAAKLVLAVAWRRRGEVLR